MIYLGGDLTQLAGEEAAVVETACEASGVTFLCPDPGVPGPRPRSRAVATAAVTALFDEDSATYAFARGPGVRVLLAALAAWLRRHPDRPSPVAAMVLCAPVTGPGKAGAPADGPAFPGPGELSVLRVPTLVIAPRVPALVIDDAAERARADAEALHHAMPASVLVEEPVTRLGAHGASGTPAQPGQPPRETFPAVAPPSPSGAPPVARAMWERAAAFFSDASGSEFGRVRSPEVEVGFHGARELRLRPDLAAEAADVLVSAYGRLSHSRDTHIRRMVDHPGTLVWARSGGLLVGCSHIRADGKWGACGTVPEYRGYGIGFRLARIGLRQVRDQFVEVGRNAPHGLRLVLGCGFRPLHDESTVRAVLRTAVRREIEPVGVDALGFVYRRKREGEKDTGPLRLCLHPSRPAGD